MPKGPSPHAHATSVAHTDATTARTLWRRPMPPPFAQTAIVPLANASPQDAATCADASDPEEPEVEYDDDERTSAQPHTIADPEPQPNTKR